MNCEDCNTKMVERKATKAKPYQYSESGLSTVYLTGIVVLECQQCGEICGMVPQGEALAKIIGHALLNKPGLLNGEEIRYLRKEGGWSAKAFSGLLGMDPAYFSRVENDKVHLSDSSDLLVRLVVREALGGITHGRLAAEQYIAQIRQASSSGAPASFRWNSKQKWRVAA